MTKRFLVPVLLLALAGCGGGEGNAPPDPGRVWFFHAMPEAATSPVFLRVNNSIVTAQATFNNRLAASFDVPSGTNQQFVLVNGNTQTTITTANLSIIPSADQLVIATGITGTGAGPQLLNLGRLDLQKANIPLTGQARVYFVNAVPEAGAGDADWTLAIQGNNVQDPAPAVLQNMNTNTMSNEQLVGIGTGPATFTATVAGQAVTSLPITLEGQSTYVVIVSGVPASAGGNPPLSVQVFKMT